MYFAEILRNPSSIGIVNASGLLKYLFKHEVIETILLNFLDIEVERLNIWFKRFVENRFQGKLTPLYNGNVVIVKENYAIGILNDWCSIRSDEVLTLSHPDYQRATLTGCN